MTNPPAAVPRLYPGRRLLFLGLTLAVLGVAGYVVQFSMQRLLAPWYLPVTGTLGTICVVVALWRKLTVWRALGLILVALLTSAEWTLLMGTRLPAYTGPIAAGLLFPTFATTLADGSTFTQRDLEGNQNHVLVFFRGRW